MTRTSIAICIALAVTLVGQIALLQSRVRDERAWAENPLLPGDSLRQTPVGMDGQIEALLGRCWLGYVASVSCGACARLASEWGRSPDRGTAYWFFAEGERRDVDAFIEGTGIRPDSVLLLPGAHLQASGFFATPTLLVGSGTMVDDLWIAQGIIDRDTAARLCTEI